jgi:hypothetical protein
MLLRLNRPDLDSLGKQIMRGQIDEALSFCGWWFSNWQISTIFTPLLIPSRISY